MSGIQTENNHLKNTALSINCPYRLYEKDTFFIGVFIWGFTSLSKLYRSYHDG